MIWFKVISLGLIAWLVLSVVNLKLLKNKIHSLFWQSMLSVRGGVDDPPPPADKGTKFTPEQQEAVNAIVQDRLAREREKYKDYDDLAKFKTEHQKQLDAQAQKDLEAKKEYDKAKEGYEGKIKELSGVITTKEQNLLNMRIGYTLSGELSKQNAYAEEAAALLMPQVIADKDGNLFIKGKDANNLDVNLTIEQGVKDFLTKRPHLVKAAARPGAGTPPDGGAGGAGAGGADDLNKLTQEYNVAQSRGDHKRAQELRVKIQQNLTAKGINRNM